jgi:hypothetical protein
MPFALNLRTNHHLTILRKIDLPEETAIPERLKYESERRTRGDFYYQDTSNY